MLIKALEEGLASFTYVTFFTTNTGEDVDNITVITGIRARLVLIRQRRARYTLIVLNFFYAWFLVHVLDLIFHWAQLPL